MVVTRVVCVSDCRFVTAQRTTHLGEIKNILKPSLGSFAGAGLGELRSSLVDACHVSVSIVTTHNPTTWSAYLHTSHQNHPTTSSHPSFVLQLAPFLTFNNIIMVRMSLLTRLFPWYKDRIFSHVSTMTTTTSSSSRFAFLYGIAVWIRSQPLQG